MISSVYCSKTQMSHCHTSFDYEIHTTKKTKDSRIDTAAFGLFWIFPSSNRIHPPLVGREIETKNRTKKIAEKTSIASFMTGKRIK
jgi:hypothetical protein